MNVVCNNPSCNYAKRQKIFSVDSISKGECPSCHGHSLLPGWAAQYQTVADHKTREKLHKTAARVKKAVPQEKRPSKKRSLDTIEFSYHDKLNKLSKAIRNDKAMQKFDSIDKDVLQSIVNAKEVNIELSELQKLFGTFKKQSATKKTSKKKSSPKKAVKRSTTKKATQNSASKRSSTASKQIEQPKPSEQPPQNENFFQ